MRLVIASQNAHKVREIRDILSGLPLEITSLLDHPEIPPIPEEGETMRENALTKARTVAELLGLPALADDSGLEVDALDGAPGVRSARFAGEDVTYADNNRLLLELMRDVPSERRGARFVCIAALAEPEGGTRPAEPGRGTTGEEAGVSAGTRGPGPGTGRPAAGGESPGGSQGVPSRGAPPRQGFRETVVEGEVRGIITSEPRGRGGFGYDPVFLVPELGRTFGEVDLATKQRYSHRARAFGRVRDLLEERLSR